MDHFIVRIMFRLRGKLEHVQLVKFSSPMPCALLRTHHSLFHSSFHNLLHSVFKQFDALNCCNHFKINLKGKAFFCANVKTGKFSPQTSIWCIWLALHGNIFTLWFWGSNPGNRPCWTTSLLSRLCPQPTLKHFTSINIGFGSYLGK